MANFGILNRLLKLQKILTPFNTTLCSSSSTLLVAQQQQQQRQLCSIAAANRQQTGLQQRHYGSKNVKKSNSSKDETAANLDITNTTLEEFRAREEKRERDFERLRLGEEEANKNSNEDDAIKRAKVDAVRNRILEAALQHVPTLGWSRNAIVRGAEDAGLPSVVHGMFPEGGFALVSYFYGKCNDELVKKLQQEKLNAQNVSNDPVDFLVRAVRTRLEMILPYKSQWPQAMALIALPQNASTALAQVLTLVDDICYYSGDQSVDLSWYTRRIGLATIMKMTELYMLQDSTPDHSKTWEFLKNRMDEAAQLQMMVSQTGDVTGHFQRSFNSAFITARNILGLGYDRR